MLCSDSPCLARRFSSQYLMMFCRSCSTAAGFSPRTCSHQPLSCHMCAPALDPPPPQFGGWLDQSLISCFTWGGQEDLPSLSTFLHLCPASLPCIPTCLHPCIHTSLYPCIPTSPYPCIPHPHIPTCLHPGIHSSLYPSIPYPHMPTYLHPHMPTYLYPHIPASLHPHMPTSLHAHILASLHPHIPVPHISVSLHPHIYIPTSRPHVPHPSHPT